MFYKLILPGPIEDLTDVRVLEWHGSPGSVFKTDELILELDTHKAVVEMRATATTFLRKILVAPGEWQQVGGALGIVSDSADEPLPASAEELTQSSINYEMV